MFAQRKETLLIRLEGLSLFFYRNRKANITIQNRYKGKSEKHSINALVILSFCCLDVDCIYMIYLDDSFKFKLRYLSFFLSVLFQLR